MKNPTLVLFPALILTLTASAQNLDWGEVVPAFGPSERYGPRMAYDSGRGKIVLFGGRQNGWLNDTWEYDGQWHLVVTSYTSVTPRYLHGMVYDSARGKVVMYGGMENGFNALADTKEYDGTSWNYVSTSSSPGPRFSHGMVFDSMRGKTVVFGGSSLGWLGDTWEYDGVDWTQVSTATSPTPRSSMAMVFDSVRSRTVMFGGWDASGPLNDTWEYDGTDWMQISPANAPSIRASANMVFDSHRGTVVLVGGTPAFEVYLNDTWEYDGIDWQPVATASSPFGRSQSHMVYDSVGQKAVMFGGSANTVTTTLILGDMWELREPNAASVVNYGAGCGSQSLALVAWDRPTLGSTVEAWTINAPVPFGAMTIGWDNTAWAGMPLPVELSVIGMPGCYVHQSQDLTGLAVAPAHVPGILSFNLTVPYSANLNGLHVYMQSVAYAPGENAMGLITSNGVDLTIGNY